MEIIKNLDDYSIKIDIINISNVNRATEKVILDIESAFRIVVKFEGILIPYEHFTHPFKTRFYFKEEYKDIALKFKLAFS